MRAVTLGHVGAIAAIIAGLVRAVLIVAPLNSLGVAGLETLYLAIDLAILLALFGIAVRLADRLGLLGVLGLIPAAIGLLVIRTGERSLFGAAAYPSGSALLAIGLAIAVAPLLRTGGTGRVAAILLIASPAAAILGGVLGLAALASTLATALFSTGLIALGLTLLPE
jgi:hypothetical protein